MSEKRDIYPQVYPVAKLILDRRFPRNVTGTENIPDVPALYTPNHLRFVDSFLVSTSYTESSGKPMRFGAKQEYFDGDGIDNHGKLGHVMKWFLENTHAIPVDRNKNVRTAFFDLQDGVRERIEAGDSVALHPEGTRSLDGSLNKFRSGAARIALALSIPIVPVGLVYEPRSYSRRTDVSVKFGVPIMPDEYDEYPFASLAKAKKAAAISEELEIRVAALTGQRRSHEYASIPS